MHAACGPARKCNPCRHSTGLRAHVKDDVAACACKLSVTAGPIAAGQPLSRLCCRFTAHLPVHGWWCM